MYPAISAKAVIIHTAALNHCGTPVDIYIGEDWILRKKILSERGKLQ